MDTKKQSVGILAYGSVVDDPREEILAVLIERKEVAETPFPIEFARTSSSRAGAPTLVPVQTGGAHVRAEILVVDTTEDDATHRLYRREIDDVGGTKRYRARPDPGPKIVQIKRLEKFGGVDVVLYAQIAPNIDELTPTNLARLAIESARRLDDGRDGISYLMNARRRGIRTPLSDEYEAEIRRQLAPRDLPEALRVARERRT